MMNYKLFFTLLIMGIIIGSMGCTAPSTPTPTPTATTTPTATANATPTPTPTATTTPTPVPTATPTGNVTTISLRSNQIFPRNVTIHAGDTIKWYNDGTEIMTPMALDGSWSSDAIGIMKNSTRVFSTTGTFEYKLKEIPSFTGTIIVTP